MSRLNIDVSAQAVTNLAANPSFYNDVTSVGTYGVASKTVEYSTERTRSQGAAVKVTATDTSNGSSLGLGWILNYSFKAGDKVSWGFWLYNPMARAFTAYPCTQQNYSLNIIIGCPQNTWTYISASTVVLADTSTLRVGMYGSFNTGEYVYMTNCIAIKDDNIPAYYADGNTPGWKWLGTPGSSVSVGYPYTLESIVGQPFAVNTTPNTIASSRPGASIGSQDGRSLYTVYSLPDPASQAAEINAISVLGVGNTNQAGGMLFRTGINTGRLDSAVRPGNGNFFRQIDGGRTQGVHIACLSVNDGISRMTLSVDGGDSLSTSIDPGGSMTNTASPTNLELISTGYTTGIAAYGFKGEHNDETRKRITAWLARKYGGPIPAGY